MKKNSSARSPLFQSPTEHPAWGWIPTVLVLSLFLVLPLVPDVKLIRLKLFWVELFLVSSVAVWGVGRIWEGRGEIRLSWPFLGLVVWTVFLAVRIFTGTYPVLAWAELRRAVLTLLAAFVSTQVVVTDIHRWWVWRGWLLGGLLGSVYAIAQRGGSLGPWVVPQMDRVMGTFGNPIFLGAYLGMTLPLAVGFLFSSTIKRDQLLGLAATVAVSLALYFSKTRAAWIGVLGAALVVGFFSARSTKGRWLLLGLFLLGGGLFVASTRSVWLRDQGHLLIWKDTLTLWKNHPLWGVGSGEFHIHFPAVASEATRAKWPPNQTVINYAHSEPLQVLAETGWVGGLLWLAPYLVFFVLTVRREKTVMSWAVGASVVAGLLTWCFSVDARFSVSMVVMGFLVGTRPPAVTENWEARWMKKPAVRAVLVGVWAVVLGVVLPRGSWLDPTVTLMGLVDWSPARPWTVARWPAHPARGVIPWLLEPHLSQKRQSAQVNFFDVRVLDAAETLSDLEKLAERFPNDVSVYEKLAFVCAKEMKTKSGTIDGAMAQRALSAYGRVIEIDPGRVGAYNNMGNIHYTLGHVPEALRFWEKALEVDPTPLDARLNLGKIYYARGELKKSADHFREILRRDPQNDEAKIYLRRMIE